jgi:DMSO/TMAO reductase YedYZ molybdopterin-dependent catalytic subunit
VVKPRLSIWRRRLCYVTAGISVAGAGAGVSSCAAAGLADLDASGNPDPYYVSPDLATARHSQTLLATHLNRQALTVEHGAPLRLLVPVKLGLKNVKAIYQTQLCRGTAAGLVGRTGDEVS